MFQANFGVGRPLQLRVSPAGLWPGGDEQRGGRAVVPLSQSLQRRRRRLQPHQGHRWKHSDRVPGKFSKNVPCKNALKHKKGCTTRNILQHHVPLHSAKIPRTPNLWTFNLCPISLNLIPWSCVLNLKLWEVLSSIWFSFYKVNFALYNLLKLIW